MKEEVILEQSEAVETMQQFIRHSHFIGEALSLQQMQTQPHRSLLMCARSRVRKVLFFQMPGVILKNKKLSQGRQFSVWPVAE